MTKINIWCPLPPSRTGPANFLYEQIPFWEKGRDVSFVVSKHYKELKLQGVSVKRPSLAAKEKDSHHVFHLANNPHHGYVYKAARSLPNNTVVVHDGSLHHLVTDLTLAKHDKAAYLSCLSEEDRQAGRRFAIQRLTNVYSERLQFYFRNLRVCLESANNVIFHSIWAKNFFRREYDLKVVHYVPLHAFTSQSNGTGFRTRLGISEKEVIIAVPGFLSPVKDIETIIELGRKLAFVGEHRVKIIYSYEKSEPSWLSDDNYKFLNENGLNVGFLDDRDFDSLLATSDFVSCLRFPSTGESSGVFAKTLAANSIPIYEETLGGYEVELLGVPYNRLDGSDVLLDGVNRILSDAEEKKMLIEKISLAAIKRSPENTVEAERRAIYSSFD